MSESTWPSIEEQLAQAQSEPIARLAGTALERFIRENQDFELLSPEERPNDKIGLPLWVRVAWRKAHPELEYRAGDPTGGYPLALDALYEWMLAHPDLEPGSERGGETPPLGDDPLDLGDDDPIGTADAAPDPGGAVALLDRETTAQDFFAAVAAAPKVGTNRRISGLQVTSRSESDIRVNFRRPRRIIAASNAFGTGQAQFWSTDGGQTWRQTTLPILPQDLRHGDPTVDWTSDGTAWATTIGISAAFILQLRAYRSADRGRTWSFDATFSGTQTAADKQMMWADHSGSSPFRNNIYVIWHNGSPVFVNRRTGPAGAWQTPIQISGAETTGTGIGSDITTNSAGHVFAMWPDTGSRRIFVAKSTNGGVSFSSPVTLATTFDAFKVGVPSFAFRNALIYVTAAAYRTSNKDLVYAAWTDLSGAPGCTTSANEPGTNVSSTCKSRIWFSRSSNGGTTWAAPTMINNQASLNDQFSPRLAVDEDNGDLVIIYDDTVRDATRLRTDLWCQTSTNDGVTWSASTRVTTAQTDETGSGADLGNQYGDYNGLSGIDGTFYPSWTDRRGGAREEIWTAKISLEDDDDDDDDDDD